MLRKRWDCGDGQREESGEIRLLSLSTIGRSSKSRARRAGRDDGDVKEKSSNISVPFLMESMWLSGEFEVWKYRVVNMRSFD